jgi:hypothetical protein
MLVVFSRATPYCGLSRNERGAANRKGEVIFSHGMHRILF